MKKYLIAIAMMLTLSMTADAAAQKHRHTPRTEQVDSTKQRDALEAYSDTTGISGADADDEEEYQYSRRSVTYSDEDLKGAIKQAVNSMDGDGIAGMVFVLLICLILFVLAPIGIIIALFYFINKNRREKYRLAQMAMQNGQPIPTELLNEAKDKDEWDSNDYAAGMRQLFLGIGLMIFLGYTAGKIGFAIGALVFFVGLGKVVVAKTSGKNNSGNANNNLDNWDNINNN